MTNDGLQGSGWFSLRIGLQFWFFSKELVLVLFKWIRFRFLQDWTVGFGFSTGSDKLSIGLGFQKRFL